MTDAEIIKALELCGKQEACCYCSLDDFGGIDKCIPHLLLNAIDLIKRQNAEIERLNEKIANLYKEMERIALKTVLADSNAREDSNG